VVDGRAGSQETGRCAGDEKKEKQKENGVRVNMLLTEADRAATRPHRKLSPVDGCNKRQALCYRL